MLIIRSAVIDTKNISKLKAKSSAIDEIGKTYKDPVNSLSDNGDVLKINSDMTKGLWKMKMINCESFYIHGKIGRSFIP